MLLYVQNFEDDNFKLFFQELKKNHPFTWIIIMLILII